MTRLRDEQLRRNQLSRDCWRMYQPHRDKVTDFLVQDGNGSESRLCVLGAGNCNDVDLARLVDAFAQVHRFDWDSAALIAGVAAQHLTDSARLVQHGDVDVTGVAEQLSAWTPEQPADPQSVRALCRQAANSLAPAVEAPFAVTASVCLLSQLIDGVRLALGEQHPNYLELAFTIRARNLRLLLELLRPGGRAVLITDFVSSTSCAELATIDERELPALSTRLISGRNFFTGLNPFVLQSLFRQDPELAQLAARVQLSLPWRWTFPARTYAVCALEVWRSDRQK